MKYIRNYISGLIFFLISGGLISFGIPKNDEDDANVVMGYHVPEKDYHADELPLHQLTHIIFSFTTIVDGEMKLGGPEAEEKLRQLVAQRKNHPRLKVMVACGGWGADGFSDMAHTKENRDTFVKSVVAFTKEYDLDDLDMDWVYPAIPAAGTGARPEDKQNFTLLMKQLRQALDTIKRKQVLTFASAGWQRYYDNIELSKVMQYVDFMNVMNYHQVGGNDAYTGHHTALGHIPDEHIQGTPAWTYVEERREAAQKRGTTYNPRSVESIIDFCIENGVNQSQLVIGAAFYGKAWKGVPPQNNGLYQTYTGSYIGWSGYSQIRKEFGPNENYTRYWDPVAKAPYLYGAKDSVFISYDDTVSVRLKTEYAIQKNLGGIMFWQLGNDTKVENNLLKSMYEATLIK